MSRSKRSNKKQDIDVEKMLKAVQVPNVHRSKHKKALRLALMQEYRKDHNLKTPFLDMLRLRTFGWQPKLALAGGSVAAVLAILVISTGATTITRIGDGGDATPATAQQAILEAQKLYDIDARSNNAREQGRYRYVKEEVEQTLNGQTEVVYYETWEDLDTGTKKIQSSLDDGTVDVVTIDMGSSIYTNAPNPVLEESYLGIDLSDGLPASFVRAGISLDELQQLSMSEVDAKLKKAGEEQFFVSAFGTKNFGLYTMSPSAINNLSSEEIAALAPQTVAARTILDANQQEVTLTSEQASQYVGNLANFNETLADFTQDGSLASRTSILARLLSEKELELLENETWNDAAALGLRIEDEIVPGVLTVYLDASTFEMLGLTADYEAEFIDIFVEQTTLEEVINDEAPNFETTQLAKRIVTPEEEGTLTGEVTDATLDRFDLSIQFPKEWGQVVPEVTYKEAESAVQVVTDEALWTYSFSNNQLVFLSAQTPETNDDLLGLSGYVVGTDPVSGETIYNARTVDGTGKNLSQIGEDFKLQTNSVGQELLTFTSYQQVNEGGETFTEVVYYILINTNDPDFPGIAIQFAADENGNPPAGYRTILDSLKIN